MSDRVFNSQQAHDWLTLVNQIDDLADEGYDASLIARMQAYAHRNARTTSVAFHTPTFKHYQTSEIAACSKSAWPAISLTGGACKLQCDHCKAKILEPMISATSPEILWHVVTEQIGRGASGALLTGGSNARNEVEYGPFLETIRKIKDAYPHFQIAAHTALMSYDDALALQQAGVDVAMMDVIGAQDTITQVYHLKRGVEDFEQTLEALTRTTLRVVPHIVIGLHYGQLLGEHVALEMIARHLPDALVLVVAMPYYATPKRPYIVPNDAEIGAFFLEARQYMPNLPLLLGCARPAGRVKVRIDTYALMAGLDAIAHPADGIVALAKHLGRPSTIIPSCCSMGHFDSRWAASPSRNYQKHDTAI